MLLKIDLEEGPYLVDVGFGAFLLERPLPFETDVEHSTAMGRVNPSQGALLAEREATGRLADGLRLQSRTPDPFGL
jgi:N-hydroxyarylamine O-acetyltransferase